MAAKTQQLQIRVTAAQKAALRARAKAAGVDLSAYVLARALPTLEDRFARVVRGLSNASQRSGWMAELESFLLELGAREFGDALESELGIGALDATTQNLVAAFVEQRAAELDVAPPTWVASVEPLERPWFASELSSLRPYLIARSPVPFRRRNLFVEQGLGARV